MISPIDIATTGYLNSPLSVAASGYLTLGTVPPSGGGGVFHPERTRVPRIYEPDIPITPDDEDFLYIVIQAVRFLMGKP